MKNLFEGAVNQNKRVIVYGLGQIYKLTKTYIVNKFEVIGYSDKNMSGLEKNYIPPEEIPNYEFDYILVTSNKFFAEIKQELVKLIGGGIKTK